MKIGILPRPGTGFSDLAASGQVARFDDETQAMRRAGADLVYFSYRSGEDSGAPRPGGVSIKPASLAALRSCDLIRVTNLASVFPAVWVARQGGPPFILTYGYDPVAVARHCRRPTFHWRLRRRLALRKAAGVIFQTQRDHRACQRWLGHARATIIANGVNHDRFPVFDRRRPRLAVVAYVGRLSAEKNLSRALVALAGSSATLVIAGDGPERSAIAEAAGRARISLMLYGTLAHEALPDFLGRCRAFLMPSLSEGSPKALFEAMATGIPCAASDHIECVEGVERFDPRSTDAIARAVSACLDGRANTERAIRHVRESHDLDQTARKEVAFMRECVG